MSARAVLGELRERMLVGHVLRVVVAYRSIVLSGRVRPERCISMGDCMDGFQFT
jgi:hypothetical protein